MTVEFNFDTIRGRETRRNQRQLLSKNVAEELSEAWEQKNSNR